MAKITQTAGRNTLGTFAPEFAHFNDDVLFGENWNNEDIDLKTRSIITDGTGNYRFFSEIPFTECKGSWGNTERNRSDHHPRSILCRLAKGLGSIQPCKRGLERGRNRKITWQKLLVRTDSHKAQMCMPLKPATTRDCGEVVQFNAGTTGTSTTPPRAADRSSSAWPAVATIRRRVSLLRSFIPGTW